MDGHDKDEGAKDRGNGEGEYLFELVLPSHSQLPPTINIASSNPYYSLSLVLAEWPCAPSYSSAKVFSTAQLGSKSTTLTL